MTSIYSSIRSCERNKTKSVGAYTNLDVSLMTAILNPLVNYSRLKIIRYVYSTDEAVILSTLNDLSA